MMNRATVVRITDDHDVFIGRPSKWGNPYVIGTHGTRKQVIALYEQYLLASPSLMACLPELVGKRLGCYCCPKTCHGDVLAHYANKLATGRRQLFKKKELK